MSIKIISISNNLYIGTVEDINPSFVVLKDVYTINNTIRDNKTIVLGKVKYIKKGIASFSQFDYIADADDSLIELYMKVISDEKA